MSINPCNYMAYEGGIH